MILIQKCLGSLFVSICLFFCLSLTIKYLNLSVHTGEMYCFFSVFFFFTVYDNLAVNVVCDRSGTYFMLSHSYSPQCTKYEFKGLQVSVLSAHSEIKFH